MQLLAKLDERCAAAYTVLFLLCLAYACLRFSDLDRSVSVTLGRDAIHATSWRSKGKPMPTPWAALRKTWTDVDWGKQFYDLIQGILPVSINEQPRDWLWPAMDLEDGTLLFLVSSAAWKLCQLLDGDGSCAPFGWALGPLHLAQPAIPDLRYGWSSGFHHGAASQYGQMGAGQWHACPL